MFNHFLPKRPPMLSPDLYRSESGDAASDAGYKWYCECFYTNLGRGWYTVQEAHKEALQAGVYYALLEMQHKAECEQMKAEREKGDE